MTPEERAFLARVLMSVQDDASPLTRLAAMRDRGWRQFDPLESPGGPPLQARNGQQRAAMQAGMPDATEYYASRTDGAHLMGEPKSPMSYPDTDQSMPVAGFSGTPMRWREGVLPPIYDRMQQRRR